MVSHFMWKENQRTEIEKLTIYQSKQRNGGFPKVDHSANIARNVLVEIPFDQLLNKIFVKDLPKISHNFW